MQREGRYRQAPGWTNNCLPMDPIAEIRRRFQKYPGVRIEEGDGWIRYFPESADGFVVEFALDDGEFVVSFEGWHERFSDVDEALNCFAFGLSDECRLKVISRGGKSCKWIVEYSEDGRWIADSETGLLIYRFWRSPRVDYRQNDLIRSAVAEP